MIELFPLHISIRPQNSLPSNGYLDARSLRVEMAVKYLIQHGDSNRKYPSHAEALVAVLLALKGAGYGDDYIARLCLLCQRPGLPA